MNGKELDRTWAWSHVEAYTDGSLKGEDRARMEGVLNADAQLAGAVDRAAQLRFSLTRMRLPKPPRGLLGRLLAVPARRRPLQFLAAPLGTVAIAFIVALIVSMGPTPRDETTQAVEEFALAMSYLQRSAEITRNKVGDYVGSGLVSAVTVSRQSLEGVGIDSDENGG
jgi:ferric-dicitrate binding protein FerR (iron transport regulator)